eukprot:CAMPEP_0114674014 /NCGR_PEP_ID=MMETSP0191-20121206/45641_1 /TAXON_ID=126664 /ORGANISM="Sorites sp." /LENGTH=217 /DNA_ID=CAMNT_0001940247 /DNA_START=27 /DNA_END=676 /DNA_ORIENTATION=+
MIAATQAKTHLSEAHILRKAKMQEETRHAAAKKLANAEQIKHNLMSNFGDVQDYLSLISDNEETIKGIFMFVIGFTDGASLEGSPSVCNVAILDGANHALEGVEAAVGFQVFKLPSVITKLIEDQAVLNLTADMEPYMNVITDLSSFEGVTWSECSSLPDGSTANGCWGSECINAWIETLMRVGGAMIDEFENLFDCFSIASVQKKGNYQEVGYGCG